MKTVGYTLASNGKYYKVLHATGTSGKNHTDAKVLCEEDGARLASSPYGQNNIKAMDVFQGMSM